MLPALAEQRSPRTMAFAALGLARAGHELLGGEAAGVLRALAGRLAELQRANATPDWYWAEDVLAYDNARLPQALIAAGARLGDDDAGARGHARRSSGTRASSASTVRTCGWSGIAAAAAARLIPARATSSRSTPRRSSRRRSRPSSPRARTLRARRAVRAFEWFLGRNRLQRSVYDFATGGCHDGLGESDVNGNEGAESTLAYLQALLALDAAGLQATLPE